MDISYNISVNKTNMKKAFDMALIILAVVGWLGAVAVAVIMSI